MAKTPTVHNPTNFEPADYVVLDYFDNRRPVYFGQDVDAYAEEVKFWEHDLAAAYGANWRTKIGHCAHCGNGNVRWITATQHVPTGDVVTFGCDCTERLGFANKLAFKLAQLQAKAEAGHARLKVWNARTAFLAARPAFAAAVAQAKGEAHAKNHFVQDVIGKLNLWGSLSDRQVAAVLSSLQRDLDTVARKAADAVEVKGPAPTGRVTVTGLILSTKVVESDFGSTLKMLLKLDNGARAWLTVPSKADANRGDTITVTATFEVSKDDASFAFGKRPTLVGVVKAQAAA